MDADDITKICVDCKFDVRVLFKGDSDDTLLEFKSYIIESLRFVNTANGEAFIKQFKQYLQNRESFQYLFNGDKITDISLIKKEFQKMLQKDPEGFYNINPDFFNQFECLVKPGKIVEVEDFKELIVSTKFIESEMLDFIKLVK